MKEGNASVFVETAKYWHMRLIYIVGIHTHDLVFLRYHCCCSLLRTCAIKMSDDDDFQSARRTESSFAALSWSRQGQIMLVRCTGACADLWSTQLKHCHSLGGGVKRERRFLPSYPWPSTTVCDPDQSLLLSTMGGRALKSEKLGREVEGESVRGKNLIRELETGLGNRI